MPARVSTRKRWAYPMGVVLAAGVLSWAIWSVAHTDAGRKALARGPVAYRWLRELPEPYDVLALLGGAVVLVVAGYVLVRVAARRARTHAARIRAGEPLFPSSAEVSAEIRTEIHKVGRQLAPQLPVDMPRPTTFVGRDRELGTVVQRLSAGLSVIISAHNNTRGIGKSALASQAAFELQKGGHFAGGIQFFACNNLAGPAGLTELVGRIAHRLHAAQALTGPEEYSARNLMQRLMGLSQQQLLVFDNVESRLPLGALLDAIIIPGHTTVLITANGDNDGDPRLVPLVLQPLDASASEWLLHEELTRQTEDSDDKRPNADDERAMKGLAERLNGVPLLIIFAASLAARGGLSLQSIIATRDRTDVARGDDDGDFDWLSQTWSRLNPSQQILFAGLSIVREESFSAGEAHALALTSVASVEHRSGEVRERAIHDFTTLHDYRLIISLFGDPNGDRYRLHDESRSYAKQQLEAMPPATRDALVEAEVEYWVRQLSTLYAEREYGRVVSVARAVTYEWDVWGKRDSLQSLLEWIVHNGGKALPSNVLWATLQLAELNRRRGHTDEARRGFEEAVVRAASLRSELMELRARRGLAEIQFDREQYAEAESEFTRSLEKTLTIGDLDGQLQLLHDLGAVELLVKRDLDAAWRRFSDGLALARELGYRDAESRELRWLAQVHAEAGRPGAARELIKESLSLARSRYHHYNAGKSLQQLAELDMQDDRGSATRYLELARQALVKAQASEDEIRDVDNRLRDIGITPGGVPTS